MGQGGKREGAGRKKLSNRYKEQTHPIRVPLSLLPTILVLLQKKTHREEGGAGHVPFIPHPAATDVQRPLFLGAVSAGTPFAVEADIDHMMDLNAHLIANPSTTFFVRVAGDSMTGANIFDGDILVVDRSPVAKSRDIVIAVVEGEMTVKRFMKSEGGVILKAENPEHSDIHLSAESDAGIWGVVMHIIHKAR